jgi:hypothetical protein
MHMAEIAWVDQLLGSDPVLGNDALEYLAALGPNCLKMFLPPSAEPPIGTAQGNLRLAKLCRRFENAAIPIVLRALRKGTWRTKIRAAMCFDLYPFKSGDRVAGQVADLLKQVDFMEKVDFDVVNAAMLSLGYMGAYSWERSLLTAGNLTDDYSFSKLGVHALKALLLMIPRTRDARNIRSLLNAIEQHVEVLEKRLGPTKPREWLLDGVVGFGRVAADVLVEKWLNHQKQLFRIASLEALAAVGLQRTTEAVVARLLDTSEDEAVRRSAARCLGQIGGSLAVVTLERLLASPDSMTPTVREGVLWGVAYLYPEADQPLNEDIVGEILGLGLEAKLNLIHSFGFRHEQLERLERFLESFLHSTDPMIRGGAALSLARVIGADAKERLAVARQEATDDFERALVTCGLIHCREPEYATLHTALCRFPEKQPVWLLNNRWKWEFVSALACDPSRPYAAAWSDLMGIDVDFCRRKLVGWGGIYQGVGNGTGSERAVVEPGSTSRDLIFISYAHADERLCKEFLKMIKPTAQKHGLKIWSDHNISPGAVWRDEIQGALTRTKIAVLLISPDFLQSDFITQNELPPLLKAASTEGAGIFWIPCRHSNVEDTEIGKFQSVTSPSRPLAGLSRVAREKELKRISQQLLQMALG